MANSDSDHAGTLDRAFNLLRAVLGDGGKSGIGAIAAQLNQPISSVHRLVALLERRGFLARNARGRYVAGIALAPVMSDQMFDRALAEISRPILKQLAIDTGQTTHLGVLRANMVTYLIKEGAAAEHLFTRETMQLEAYCSGIGKMLLAQLSTDALADYLEQGELIALTAWTIVDPLQLADHLITVRQQDYALDDREITNDLSCLAVPVRRGDGNVVAAVSIAGNIAITASMPTLLTKLRAAASAIEGRLAG